MNEVLINKGSYDFRLGYNEQDLHIAVRIAIAQVESESLSEAIKWGLKRGFETGNSKLYTRRCFGYKKMKMTKNYLKKFIKYVNKVYRIQEGLKALIDGRYIYKN